MKQGSWIICGSVLLGIALGTLPYHILFPSVVFLGIGICLVLIRTFAPEQAFLLAGFALFLITFWYGQERIQDFDTLTAKRSEKEVYRVATVPERKSFYQAIILKPLESSWWHSAPKVLWQGPFSISLDPGDRVELSCDLNIPENFTPDFDYRRYLAKEGIGYVCEEADSFEKSNGDRVTRIYQWAYAPRFLVEKGIHQSIPEPEAGLAKGLLLGGSSHLSEPLREQFTRLGLTHIVAVSGYNIVLIVNAILAAGLAFHLWRKQATLLAFLGTAFFILLIGAPASAVRAGLMALAAFGAFLIGRMHYSLLAVTFTATFMVLWNPLYLWYDAGFQLSFLATVAVIVAMRAVEARLSSLTFIRMFQEIVWLSVWVHLFLLPILLYQFGIFTAFSIPANILFLPLVPVAMLASFFSSVVTLLFPPTALIVGWIAYLPLTVILRGTYALNQLPEITVPVQISLISVIIWYSALLFAIVHFEARRTQKQYEKNFQCSHSAHRP